jgi:hypothetical protein
MSMKGYRYDNLETRAFIPVSTEHLDTALLEKTEKHKRPEK